MPRRVSLPGASELFRPTQPEPDRVRPESDGADVTELKPAPETRPAPTQTSEKKRGTGRVRHEEKITVYVSSDELIALESARLRMRAEFGTGVDRGRIVREALAMAMADLARNGGDSDLVTRLTST